jgi:hypothetical protein
VADWCCGEMVGKGVGYERSVFGGRGPLLELMCRARFNRDGTNAQTRFRLSENRTSPFESGGVST